MRVALPVLAMLVLAGCLQGATDDGSDFEGTADTVLQGGRLWSAGKQVGFASGLAIHDGRIVAIGEDMDSYIGDDTEVMELAGATVLPGFRDAHMHSPLEDESPVRTVEGAVFERPLKPAYAPASMEDQAAGDQGNFAFQAGFHGHRQAAYAAAGSDAETAYERCEAASPDTVARLVQEYKAIEAEMAAQGITTVVEALTLSMSHYEALRQLEEQGESKIRWLLRVVPGCYEHMDAMGVDATTPSDWVRLHGVKLYGDGFLGAWIAALEEPYADRPGWNGILVYTPAALDGFIQEAADRGLHVGSHAIGDATIQQVLDAYERVGVTPDDRWTVEHVQITTPEIIDRFAGLGVVPSIQLSFATTDQRMAEDRVGPDRVADAYDWAAFAEAGVVIAGGSDYPIEVITPLWGLQREVTRQEVDGTPEGGWYADNGLDLDQALTSITYGTAYAAGEDDERGTLVVGNIADLTVVKEDLFAIPADDIAAATVILTMVNGKVTFEGERSYPPPGTM